MAEERKTEKRSRDTAPASTSTGHFTRLWALMRRPGETARDITLRVLSRANAHPPFLFSADCLSATRVSPSLSIRALASRSGS